MAGSKSPKRLGRGLNTLINSGVSSKTREKKNTAAAKKSAKNTSAISSDFTEIPLDQIKRSPYQPRKEINEDDIRELANSIKAEGLLQPIVVRKVEDHFELIAGERRFRSYKMLELASIPARIMMVNNASAASLALIENLQREGLNPIEESMGYASLIRDFDLTNHVARQRVGLSLQHAPKIRELHIFLLQRSVGKQ